MEAKWGDGRLFFACAVVFENSEGAVVIYMYTVEVTDLMRLYYINQFSGVKGSFYLQSQKCTKASEEKLANFELTL